MVVPYKLKLWLCAITLPVVVFSDFVAAQPIDTLSPTAIPSYPPPATTAQYPPSPAIPQYPPPATMAQYPPSPAIPEYAPPGMMQQYSPSSAMPEYAPPAAMYQYPPQAAIPQYPPAAPPQYAPAGFDWSMPSRETIAGQPSLPTASQPLMSREFDEQHADYSMPGSGLLPEKTRPVDWEQGLDEVKQLDGCDCKSKTYSDGCPHCSGQRNLLPQPAWLRIGGWIDQGVTFNFDSPQDRSNTRLFFNDRSNDYLLNQVYLFAEVPVCNDGYGWDFGGRVDVNYGRDSRFITVPGLERNRDGTTKWNAENALYGLAMPQIYGEIAAPIAHGASLKVGHFYANMGYERIAAPDNFFYSHSYSFIYGQPFTFTGAVATIKPTETLTYTLGYTAGWDIFDSTSDVWGVLAGIRWATLDGRTSLGLQVNTGNDVTSASVNGVMMDAMRVAYSLTLQHCLTERLRYVLQHNYGNQKDGQNVVNLPSSTITFDDTSWYSFNQYLVFDHTEKLSSGLRVEWFYDDGNSRASIPMSFDPGGPVFNGGHYVGITGGLNWRPHANVMIRPELRWDWSDLQGNPNVPGGDSSVRAFDDGKSDNQFTAALDVILQY